MSGFFRNVLARLGIPDGSALAGHTSGASLAGTVQAGLNNMHGVDVTMHPYLAHPSATSAQNTTAFNAAIAAAVLAGVPVFVPPIGTYKIRRLASVVGDLTVFSTDEGWACVKVDGDNWPYTSSGEPIIAVTGSFFTHGITWDQNWTGGDVSGYRDDRNPATWGGYWLVQATCTNLNTLSVKDCKLKNVYRGFFAAAADPSLGGSGLVRFTNNTSEALSGPSQTLIAAEAPLSMTVSDNPRLKTKRWDDAAGYDGNGISFVIAWGGTDVRIDDNTVVGYQLVARGPRSLLWTAATSYVAGEEYLNVDVTYRVTTGYISGATFGATDLDNTAVTFNPTTDISVTGNRLTSPIADTAIYGWDRTIVDRNIITNSGDMGIAASGSSNLIVSNNIVDGTRNGGLDLTGNGKVTSHGNIVIDIARASDGVYGRIDTINPNVFASNGGFNLAAIAIGLPSGLGVKDVVLTGNNCYFRTLPPLTDPGPNNGGLVRAQVQGIYSACSSNPAAYNTVTCTGNSVADYEADMPGFFVSVPILRFYSSAVTGTPRAGEVFRSASARFVLVSQLGAGSFLFVRKYQGASGPFSGQVFTGDSSGATITAANPPQLTNLKSVESGNNDYTSKYITDTSTNNRVGVTTVDPASIANGATFGFAIVVSGAAVGDFVLVAPPYQIQGLQMTTYVSNANEVTVVLRNDTGAAIDLASGDWKARVTNA